jgi:hypothetical protein
MSRAKIKAEALEILIAPGGRFDSIAEGTKNPDVLRQIIQESLDIFVSQDPQPTAQSPEELVEAFLQHTRQYKKTTS